MNKKDLQALRQEKENAMANIVETRSENMTDEVMETLKTFKEEILEIDRKVEAIDELRSIALKNSAPVEVKKADKEAEHVAEFRNYISGNIDLGTFEKRTETLVTHGGNIVPDNFVNQLNKKIVEYGKMFDVVSKDFTATGNTRVYPMIDTTADDADWTAEGGLYATSTVSTSTVTLAAHKITDSHQITKELLTDNVIGLESELISSLGEKLSRKIEWAIIKGNGADQPLGILNDPSTKSVTSSTAGTVLIEDISRAIYELQPSSREKAVIYVEDSLMKELMNETDTTGRKLLQASAGATAADRVKFFIDGYPIVIHNNLDVLATASVSCFIGNPSDYKLRIVKGVDLNRDPYTGMDRGLVSYFVDIRIDGKVINANDSFVKIVTA